MNSISKTPLSREQIQTIVNHHFGPQTLLGRVEELREGYFNASYYFELPHHPPYVLKIAPPAWVKVLRYEQNIITAEVAVMELLQHQTNIPLPAVYCFDPSGQLVEPPFFIMAYVPGTPLHQLRQELTPAVYDQIQEQLGHYTRQINQLTHPTFGSCVPSAPHFASWSAAFDHLVSQLLQDGAEIGVPLPLPYEVLYAKISQHFDPLAEVTTPHLVHWDLWDGNVIVDPTTQLINGLIDFERALWADPLMEVNFRAWQPDSAFGRGYYGYPHPLTPAEQTRRTLYNIYLYLVMIIECYVRQYPTSDQENWAREQLDNALNALHQ